MVCDIYISYNIVGKVYRHIFLKKGCSYIHQDYLPGSGCYIGLCLPAGIVHSNSGRLPTFKNGETIYTLLVFVHHRVTLITIFRYVNIHLSGQNSSYTYIT